MPSPSARTNLKGGRTLVIDADQFTRSLVVQILRGIGMDSPSVATTGAQAKSLFAHNAYDLCIIEAVLPDMQCSDFVRWLRRLNGPVRFTPVIVLTGFTQHTTVATVRDAGANAVVKKPVAPATLLDHIIGVARNARPFIEAGEYVGPDRRFKNTGPPGGFERRASERDAAMAEAADTGANADQANPVPEPEKANAI